VAEHGIAFAVLLFHLGEDFQNDAKRHQTTRQHAVGLRRYALRFTAAHRDFGVPLWRM